MKRAGDAVKLLLSFVGRCVGYGVVGGFLCAIDKRAVNRGIAASIGGKRVRVDGALRCATGRLGNDKKKARQKGG